MTTDVVAESDCLEADDVWQKWQKRNNLMVDESGKVVVKYGQLPTWNPDVEALRLRINICEQTVEVDTVAYNYGDDVNSYKNKTTNQSPDDVDEYRVMVRDHDTEWVAKCYKSGAFHERIDDFIIAAKLYLADDCDWRNVSDKVKRKYKERMVRQHRDTVEAFFNPDV